MSSEQPAAASAEPPLGDAESAEIALLQRELGRARQKIATIDRIDQGTGLLRFPYFQEMLRRDLAMARRDRRFVTILVFEIVEFAVYRQTFGDKAADSCQRMIGAQIMRALRRAGDLCARYDDTTLVAAVVGQHASEVQPLAERIADGVGQLKLHNPRAKGSRYIETRAIVIGCPPGAHDDPGPLIERAIAEARGDKLAARVG
jgi:diguanylate cyclase (GGDEF)-like protein